MSMCEVLERKDRKQAIPYESDADKTDEEIVEGLMEITALFAHRFIGRWTRLWMKTWKKAHSFSTSFLFRFGQ